MSIHWNLRYLFPLQHHKGGRLITLERINYRRLQPTITFRSKTNSIADTLFKHRVLHLTHEFLEIVFVQRALAKLTRAGL